MLLALLTAACSTIPNPDACQVTGCDQGFFCSDVTNICEQEEPPGDDTTDTSADDTSGDGDGDGDEEPMTTGDGDGDGDGDTPEPTQASFDIVFPSEIFVASNAGCAEHEQAAFMRIVNTGTEPLDLSTFRVPQVTIQQAETWPNWTADVLPNGLAIAIDPGFGAGSLAQTERQLARDAGLVPEPTQGGEVSLVSFEWANYPWDFFTVSEYEITVEVENARAALIINSVASGTSGCWRSQGMARVSSIPIP